MALGYVEAAYAKPGTEIAVVIREKPVKAEVVKIPIRININRNRFIL